MILSFHPMIEGDVNRLCAGRDPDAGDVEAALAASVILLPQGCQEPLYDMAVKCAPLVFPNYTARFQYPGKAGQARLFQKCGAPHPKTLAFDSLEEYESQWNPHEPPLPLPCVFKFNWGGEGSTVHLVNNSKELARILEKAQICEQTGQTGFVLQELIPAGGRSLRVAVIHQTLISYWRVAGSPGGFATGISQGGRIERDADPHLIARAEDAVRDFCAQTGVNLAGFDILFPAGGPDPGPLFLEINYFFGRRGLGGSERFYILLLRAVDEWLQEHDPGLKLPLASGM